MKHSSLYASPLRVYILLALLAVAGIIAGLTLPISLFPNSSKPVIRARASYGQSTADEFKRTYGDELQGQLKGITELKVKSVTAKYTASRVDYNVEFEWGEDPNKALKEVESVTNSWSAILPQEIRDSVNAWVHNENSGFIAISFYSESKSLDELWDILDSAVGSKISSVPDAASIEIWNPSRKEIRIELKPETLASLQVFPSDVEAAVTQAISTHNGGSVQLGLSKIRITMPRSVNDLSSLGDIPVQARTGRVVHLSDIATIDFGLQSASSRIAKTSGSQSLLLFASPKPGGNVKNMAEDIKRIVQDALPHLPKDTRHKLLVDPSEFIRSAVNNVFHEVAIGSLLAVSVLFVFIGTLRNVATAAIEIPLSLVLAFILMKFADVNINLISLGGLALSAGMNVDASVVVMENIFRHFEPYKGQAVSFSRKIEIVQNAVAEVRGAIISSTIASLVVFVPLLVTSGLSQAILGDLAKAVVFSHGFSAIVALILVPTVRLHIMSKSETVKGEHSLFESQLEKLERKYSVLLGKFMMHKPMKWLVCAGVILSLFALSIFVLPRLKREVVGKPDSDMIFMDISSKGNSKIRQMETTADEVGKNLLAEFSNEIDYTYTEIGDPNWAMILARLKNKGDMTKVWHDMEAKFANTPELNYSIEPWNPSELPIPNPPEFRVTVSGGDLITRRDTALDFKDALEASRIFDRISTDPDIERAKVVNAVPDLNQWTKLGQGATRLSLADVMDLSRIATEGRKIGSMPLNDDETKIFLRFPDGTASTLEDVMSLPIGVANKIVPLKSLVQMNVVEAPPSMYLVDGQEMFAINGRLNESSKSRAEEAKVKAENLLQEWQAKRKPGESDTPQPTLQIEDAGKDITDAIRQLSYAVAGSILLIFVVLLIQFGSIVESLLVLVAVPLGFIGVMTSLFIFRSSLSLNSVLGVILLNGIAVNNSIILVDFIRRLAVEGRSPYEAALHAARLRLRPILITSLTTVLGMMPIALGFGEGGRILQPLGIAVAGGLWISMILTLFLVPALQVSYMEWKQRV